MPSDPPDPGANPVDDVPGKDGYQGKGANQDAPVPVYEPGANPPGTNPPVPTPDTGKTPVPGSIPGQVVGQEEPSVPDPPADPPPFEPPPVDPPADPPA